MNCLILAVSLNTNVIILRISIIGNIKGILHECTLLQCVTSHPILNDNGINEENSRKY